MLYVGQLILSAATPEAGVGIGFAAALLLFICRTIHEKCLRPALYYEECEEEAAHILPTQP